MPPGVVTHQTVEAFQEQYGSLYQAAERYLEGTMPEGQRRNLELVAPTFIGIVSQDRLFRSLTWILVKLTPTT